MNSFYKRISRIRERLPDFPQVVLVWQDGRRSSAPFLEAVDIISNTPGVVGVEAVEPGAQALLIAMLPSGQDFSELESIAEQIREKK